MLHLYALVRHPADLAETRGIGGAHLRAVPVDDQVDAVVSAMNGRTPATDDAILAHAEVVEALASSNDAVLPARFAGGVVDAADLRRRLDPQKKQLLTALDRVRGCTEVGLRVLQTAAAGGDEKRPQSGREYMQRRLSEVGRADKLARELHKVLAQLARESTHRVLAKSDIVLTAAYLVPREEADTFQAAIVAAEREWPEVTLVCTGPWPPYSFALLDADDR
jgi:hypothetical protein